MSNNKSLVQVVDDKGSRLQWAKGLFYRKEGEKHVVRSKSLKYAVISLFIIATVVGLFNEDKPAKIEGTALTVPGEIAASLPSIKFEIHNDLKTKIKNRVSYNAPIQRLKMVSRKGVYLIPPGSMARAKLITGGSNGPLKAKLTEPLVVNGEKYLEEGTILLGSGSSTDERLMIRFNEMVFPDATFSEVKAVGYDFEDKIIGLRGSKAGRVAMKFAANTGLKFVAGVSQGLQESEVQQGVAVKKPTLKNALLQGAGLAALEQSDEFMKDLREKQTIIEVKMGTELWVVFGG